MKLSLELRNEAVTVRPRQQKASYLPIFWIIEVLSDEVGNPIQQVVSEEHTLVYRELQDTFVRHYLLEQGRRVLCLLESELVRRMEHKVLVRRLGKKR